MEPVKSSLRTFPAMHAAEPKLRRAVEPTKVISVKVKLSHLALIKEALATLAMTSALVEATIIGTKTVETSQMTSAERALHREKLEEFIKKSF